MIKQSEIINNFCKATKTGYTVKPKIFRLLGLDIYQRDFLDLINDYGYLEENKKHLAISIIAKDMGISDRKAFKVKKSLQELKFISVQYCGQLGDIVTINWEELFKVFFKTMPQLQPKIEEPPISQDEVVNTEISDEEIIKNLPDKQIDQDVCNNLGIDITNA
jgi:uncharacterized membrane protein (Fun14 family)